MCSEYLLQIINIICSFVQSTLSKRKLEDKLGAAYSSKHLRVTSSTKISSKERSEEHQKTNDINTDLQICKYSSPVDNETEGFLGVEPNTNIVTDVEQEFMEVIDSQVSDRNR